MPTTQYQLHLKGYVGGYDFDRDFVDYILGKNAGKPVNVLIDSLGGSLATALSIASAFRNHGDVTVHFVGMNASAATIASLGAKHISIDSSAMYLVFCYVTEATPQNAQFCFAHSSTNRRDTAHSVLRGCGAVPLQASCRGGVLLWRTTAYGK